MQNNHGDLSDDMYRRLYRLMNRNVSPRLIATTLKLPLGTVQNVISRLEHHKDSEINSPEGSGPELYLDIYLYPKTRYTKVQLVGMVVETTVRALEIEFEKVFSSKWKAIALEMSDLLEIDECGSRAILQFYELMEKHNRFVAILDPSSSVEAHLESLGLEKKVPIFGTINAFEAHAFSPGDTWKTKS